eukprot:CAMPEP_0178907604 /NCGR_PEP_ID=MMETSP0786-20121207/7462_1 /TAXON_ID=186022 /ORGANISM="Thalassionema frauenfeldii, Strain CCMP 1798" /LENGTH=108 /DNA_ID=CAMNT_0020579419 /DNA_START=181 /DNA_END=509 /DNA_ORIENTATION=+
MTNRTVTNVGPVDSVEDVCNPPTKESNFKAEKMNIQLPDSMDAMDLEDWGVIFEPFPPSSEYQYRVKITIKPGSDADKASEWTNVKDGMLVIRNTSSIDRDYNDPDIE